MGYTSIMQKKKKKHMFDYWFGCQKKVKLLKISQTGGIL